MKSLTVAFHGCMWQGGADLENFDFYKDPEHPWGQELRDHICEQHGEMIRQICEDIFPDEDVTQHQWDFYKEAIAVIERSGIPIVGPSVDRRSIDRLVQVYKDHNIRSLICFCCAQVNTDTGQHRSPIEERSGEWLYNLSASTLMEFFVCGIPTSVL